nr:CocE/NonD family hydrolase [Xanthobacter dioxanivorans]
MSSKSEVRDGMRIDWDVPITMDDGVVLRADIFRPLGQDKVPAIMTYGPYGKGLAFQDGYKTAWEIMARDYPDALEGSSNMYQSWEVADPEKWVPDGYACVRIDSRGQGAPRVSCRSTARGKHRTSATASSGSPPSPGAPARWR